MQQLQNVIESAFERRADVTPANVDTVTREAVNGDRPWTAAPCASPRRSTVNGSPISG